MWTCTHQEPVEVHEGEQQQEHVEEEVEGDVRHRPQAAVARGVQDLEREPVEAEPEPAGGRGGSARLWGRTGGWPHPVPGLSRLESSICPYLLTPPLSIPAHLSPFPLCPFQPTCFFPTRTAYCPARPHPPHQPHLLPCSHHPPLPLGIWNCYSNWLDSRTLMGSCLMVGRSLGGLKGTQSGTHFQFFCSVLCDR